MKKFLLSTAALVILGMLPLFAQWLKYPTAGVPRKTGGKVDMFAPTPRLADGKPDFSRHLDHWRTL